MADNDLKNINLCDMHIVVNEKFFNGDYPIPERVFLCEGGFGVSPKLRGEAIIGRLIHTGERGRIERSDIQRKATEDEVRAAEKLFEDRN